MRRAQFLQATAQDLRAFCASRPPICTHIPQRRNFRSARQIYRQQEAVSLEEDEDFEFGAFATKEEPPPPPPPPPHTPPKSPSPPSLPVAKPAAVRTSWNPSNEPRLGGRLPASVDPTTQLSGSQEQRYTWSSDQQLRNPGPRTQSAAAPTQEPVSLRDLRPGHSNLRQSTVEANVSPQVTSSWSIRRVPLKDKAAKEDNQPLRSSHVETAPSSRPSSQENPVRNSGSRRLDLGKRNYQPVDDRFKGTDWLPQSSARQHIQPQAAPRAQKSTHSPFDTSLDQMGPKTWTPPVSFRPDEQRQPGARQHLQGKFEVQSQRASTGFGRTAPSGANVVSGLEPFPTLIPEMGSDKKSRFDFDEGRGLRHSRGRRGREVEADTRRAGKKGKPRNVYRSKEEDDDDFDVEEYHAKKRQRQKIRNEEEKQEEARKRLEIPLPDFISVGSLANELNLRYSRFARIMQKFGYDEINHDHILSADDAALIVEEAGFIPVTESKEPDGDLHAQPLPDDMSVFPQRPPVVTIMGHVDHGKTTMLDYMRKSSIVASEHGGITQHIGAFSVPMPSGKTITFLDTPGHAAFLSMRQRGANVTDIIILVIAADDGVMPQTLEAIKHANAAKVPMIVALNKTDKPDARPDHVKSELARHGVDIEDYGGEVQVIPVSGKTGQGMSDLEEAIVALSEVQDRRAPIDGKVEGWVLESSTKEAGKVATVLVRRGTLRIADVIVAGTEYCRVRIMRDEHGNELQEVLPGMPVEVVGWRGQPTAGDEVLQAENERQAHDVTAIREAKRDRLELGQDIHAINDTRRKQQLRHEKEKAIAQAKKNGVKLPEELEVEQDGSQAHGAKNVYFVIKGDVSGSVEAVVNAVSALGNQDVRPYILRAAVGPISESDIDHATAAGGHVVNFNMPVPPSMQGMAERAGTKILDNNVIYRLVNDVKACLEDVLQPVKKSRVVAEAEIAQVFEINVKKRVFKKIAGCKIRNGTVKKSNKVRVVRGEDMTVIFDGHLESLRNVKKNVEEMSKGTECGIGFQDWQDFLPGDMIQSYEEWEEKAQI